MKKMYRTVYYILNYYYYTDLYNLYYLILNKYTLCNYLINHLDIKKYIRPEYIRPTEDGTQAKRVIAALPNMPIAKSYVGASLLSHLMVSKYIDHLPIYLSLIHISEPTRRTPISYAVFCLKKKNNKEIA